MSSSTEAIGESTIQSVGFESVERDEEKVKGLALDAATQTHFNGVKDALMEVVKADSQRTQSTTPPAAKNSMITTFKIMKIVMKTLRKTSDSGKEMNKLIKKEWEAVSNKQSDNHQTAKDNVDGSGNWQLLSVAGSQAHFLTKQGLLPLATTVLEGAGACGIGRAAGALAILNTNKDAILKGIEGAQSQIGSAMGQIGKQKADAVQYDVGIKESLFSHEVQTHTSEYQNASQQQTSDKQAVDNAADTAKQLIRVQGEILMGKAG
jgi:hypothetical protein